MIVDGIDDMAGKRFAVIINEAHSSQDGSSPGTMNSVMGGDEQDDIEEKILSAIKNSKMRGNASYFAFTATPKNSTLEKFGEQQADGRFEPFHLYSMKQAIEGVLSSMYWPTTPLTAATTRSRNPSRTTRCSTR